MGQIHTVGKHRTTNVLHSGGRRVITYHSTPVVSFDDNTIVLNTGGYETATTKIRMNQTSNQYSLNYYVYQEDFIWYVDYRGQTYQFEQDNTLTLAR